MFLLEMWVVTTYALCDGAINFISVPQFSKLSNESNNGVFYTERL